MKYLIYLLLLLPVAALAQPKLYSVEPVPNQQVAYSGDLAEGTVLTDLSWAWQSNNACFPETQKSKFTGKHLLFTGIIPANSEITVTVIPEDTTANFSLYAYEIGVNDNDLVPNLPRCIRCEADHKRERKMVNKPPQDHTRTVSNLVALSTPYRMVIGVAGAEGLEEGKFSLVISTKSKYL